MNFGKQCHGVANFCLSSSNSSHLAPAKLFVAYTFSEILCKTQQPVAVPVYLCMHACPHEHFQKDASGSLQGQQQRMMIS